VRPTALLPLRILAIISFVAVGALILAAPAGAQILLSGSSVGPETDLSPEQEQNLLGEYWTVAKRYKIDTTKTVADFSVWTRDRLAKVQSIYFQPEKPRPEYIKSRQEWAPDTLRLAAMLHSDLGVAALQKRDIPEFEFQMGLADGWFILADNKLSTPGSLRSRWTISVARLLLVNGDIGMADRMLNRAVERIANDPAILLTQGTVKETQASRFIADLAGGRLDAPATAAKPRDSSLTAAQASLEKALKLQPALVEAKLRLAHVFAMKGDDAHAYSLISEVLAAKPPPAFKYLGSLMGGAVLERSRQFDAAAKSYVEAILAMPDGQSAYLALANILHKSGQKAEAGAVMDRMFARGAVGANADPWWTYPLGLDLSMDKQFEEYRTIVRK
jgi:tetratricopeptide (TPR) repeat protein